MAKPFVLAVISVFSVLFVCSSVFAESPFLVAHKRAISHRNLNSDLERFSVSLDIYNTGSDPAYDVTLTDDNWAEEIFDTIIGNTSKTWERIDSGSLVSHSFELESKVKTVYYATPALITYRTPTKSKLQEAYSTPVLPLKILAVHPAQSKLETAKVNLSLVNYISDNYTGKPERLLSKYSSHISVAILVILFARIITAPSKIGSKKKH